MTDTGGRPQLTADPDDALWEGPTGAVAAVLEQPKRLLLPCCGEVPPSLTAKRQKGKILQLLPFDLSVRPNAEGAWLCTTCPATYESRAQLFGHVRFCEGQNVWSCEWCGCRESETHHKASGPSGAKTLCSACGARFRSGHNTPPAQNDKGEYACDFCGRGFPSISSLGGHRRFCDGGMWRCAWCHLSGQECGNKSIGPDGPATLCTSCSQRWKSGHSGPPPKDETGRFVCEECARTFDTISGLGSHRARCDGGVWRCEWCNADYASTTGKGPGPNGAKTLCSACSARFRGGASGPPTTNDQGKFVCGSCERTFDTLPAVSSHKRRCDGGKWRCAWCECKADECTGKGPGPGGPSTLCANCSGRYRNGATGAVKRDDKGNFLCDCGRAFATSAGLGGHRRNCKLQAGSACPVVGASLVVSDRASSPTPVAVGTSVDTDEQAPCSAASPSPSPLPSRAEASQDAPLVTEPMPDPD